VCLEEGYFRNHKILQVLWIVQNFFEKWLDGMEPGSHQTQLRVRSTRKVYKDVNSETMNDVGSGSVVDATVEGGMWYRDHSSGCL
jgi:hypothetical protein